ncbi:MAG: TolC family protein [Bryobacterales bacterium]|nr:TolC family protein [Bryobacterales bacterium]
MSQAAVCCLCLAMCLSPLLAQQSPSETSPAVSTQSQSAATVRAEDPAGVQPELPQAPPPLSPVEFTIPSGSAPLQTPSYLLPEQPGQLPERYRDSWMPRPALGSTVDPASLPLVRLDDVLSSVAQTYPLMTVAELDRTIAQAEYLMAQGSFDLRLTAGSSFDELGFYRSRRLDMGFEQATQTLGATFFGGYSVSGGNFPGYNGGLDTRAGGEWRGGMFIPLLRNRPIDQRRAELQAADIGRSLANFSVEEQQINFTFAASQAYWAWLAAGERYRYASELLQIATLRQSILSEAAELGQIPVIDVTDNQRAILQRQSTVIATERGLQQAAIALSLFLRDPAGNPYIPRNAQLPREFPAPSRFGLDRLQVATADALLRRPELRFLENERRQVEVDVALARNARNPNLDFQLTYTQGVGDARNVLRGPEELKGGLFFDLPFQRRRATGRLQASEAKAAQIRAKEQFQKDKIAADVRNALLAVQMAYDRLQLLRQEVDVATQLQGLEKDRFDLGDSTLFLVNLREEATFDAELRAVSAIEEYFRAYAGYQAATAEALTGNPLSLP